jgi:hypothetical protein
MYAQRDYLTRWEKFQLDIDHIAPSEWMVFRAGPLSETVFWKVRKVSSYWRFAVLRRTGNYRYWPDSLNRAYRDKSPKEKYIQNQVADQIDAVHSQFGLQTVKDILDASGIDLEDAKQWDELCVENPKIWNDERFASFKRLVYKRRYKMYKKLFEAMQWDEWVDKINES